MSRGGTREGAGRPVVAPDVKKKSLTVRVSKWVLDALNRDHTKESKGNLVEHALIKTYRLKKESDN